MFLSCSSSSLTKMAETEEVLKKVFQERCGSSLLFIMLRFHQIQGAHGCFCACFCFAIVKTVFMLIIIGRVSATQQNRNISGHHKQSVCLTCGDQSANERNEKKPNNNETSNI